MSMHRFACCWGLFCIWLSTGVVSARVCSGADLADWLGFRGDGTSQAASDGPDSLSLADDGNLKWKIALPGKSVAGPIVVGDLVVTTSSSGEDGEVLHICGVDLNDGTLRWEQTFRATGRPFCHPTSANAAPSPMSDGRRIYAFFSSNDLICLDLTGRLIWYRGLGFDYPQAGNDIGMASSPTMVDGVVVVQVESQGDSFAAGIDALTGKNLWRIDRPRAANWSSPLVIPRPDQSNEVVFQSRTDVLAVEPRTGKIRWEINEPAATIASATLADSYLLIPGSELLALDVGGSASTPEVVWRNNKLVPRNASLVVGGERLYALKGSVLVAGNRSDGETIWQQRLSGLGGTWATPVFANDKLYIFDQAGKGIVVADQGDKAAIISEVDLGEAVLASPAVVSGRLIVRGEQTLFCFDSSSDSASAD